MKYLIVDTSSMLFGFSYGKNVFESAMRRFPGCKLLVSKGIIRELTRISTRKGINGLAARIALLELKAKKIDVDNISAHADSWILDASSSGRGNIVITNDTILAERLLLKRVKVYKMSRSGMLRSFNQ